MISIICTLAEKFLWIFSDILSEFVRILAALSERRQSNSKKFRKEANEFKIIQEKRLIDTWDFVAVATYSFNMNQTRAGAPESCLSCYSLSQVLKESREIFYFVKFDEILSVDKLEKKRQWKVYFELCISWTDAEPMWKIQFACNNLNVASRLYSLN